MQSVRPSVAAFCEHPHNPVYYLLSTLYRPMDHEQHGDTSSMAGGLISPAEQQVRIDLAACYRLCALNQWDDLVYTHISANVPGELTHVTAYAADGSVINDHAVEACAGGVRCEVR